MGLGNEDNNTNPTGARAVVDMILGDIVAADTKECSVSCLFLSLGPACPQTKGSQLRQEPPSFHVWSSGCRVAHDARKDGRMAWP